jgi:hypothetical protein
MEKSLAASGKATAMEAMSRECEVHIEGKTLKYNVSGEIINGGDTVLLEQDDDLLHGQPWRDKGYTILPFLADGLFPKIKEGMTDLIYEAVSEVVAVDRNKFSLESYHRVVNKSELHAQVVARTRLGWLSEHFPVPLRLVEERIGEILGIPVTAYNTSIEKKLFFLRIIRPSGANDFNPPHRDVWLDRLRNCVNIYVPMSGSNKNSSLPLVEGSHLWKESEIWRTKEGGTINGLAYSVPSVVKASRPLNMIRPLPRDNEMILFSPYLIHGGGVNLNPDMTRTSIEIRFWRL